jgi:hypothetical protein
VGAKGTAHSCAAPLQSSEPLLSSELLLPIICLRAGALQQLCEFGLQPQHCKCSCGTGFSAGRGTLGFCAAAKRGMPHPGVQVVGFVGGWLGSGGREVVVVQQVMHACTR